MPAHHHGETLHGGRLSKRRGPPVAKSATGRATRLQQALQDARVQAQVDLAQRLQLTPAAIATLEQHTDMYLAILGRCLASLGGTLEIIVQFPDERVAIKYFGEMDVGCL
jgi:hypothetical protein